jgi:endonuclease III
MSWDNPNDMHPTLHHEPAAEGVHLRAILRKLAQVYGSPRWNPSHDPLGELVATILSQNTSDVNSDRAFVALRTAYRTWEEVRQAPPDDLAAVIRSGGLARLKSRRIQEILHTIKTRQGRLDLDFLLEMPMPAARAYLGEFPGVGPKTIACVLLFACGYPALPVDTHIYRVTTRLGLLPASCSAERAHAVLEPLIPPAQVYRAHVNLIRHGRMVCKARLPDCRHCCLQSRCPYPQQSMLASAAGREASTSGSALGTTLRHKRPPLLSHERSAS